MDGLVLQQLFFREVPQPQWNPLVAIINGLVRLLAK